MADNVLIDNGVLPPFEASADDTPSGLVQRVKPVVSGDGDDTPIPADTANGLDVDVTRVVPGTGSTNLGKQEDAAHASGDVGVMALAVRKNTAAALSDADGDYTPVQVDSTGALRVAASGLSGGVQFNEDAAHASGDAGTLALAVRKDSPGSMENADGDYAAIQVDSQGYMRVRGTGDLYGPTEYTVDDALPTNPTGPAPMTRRVTTPVVTAPVDGDAQGLRSSSFGDLWAALDLVNHPYGAATVKRFVANLATGATDSVLVAAVATKKIRVLQLYAQNVHATLPQQVTFGSTAGAGATTVVSPAIVNPATAGEVLPFSQVGWFETVAGEGLVATTPSGGGTTAILGAYVEV